MAQDVVITPASGKMEFFQDVGGSAVANIQLDSSTSDLSLSTTSGNLIIGDASRDVYIGDGINSVDIVFEQNGEIRGLTNKTLTLGQSDSIVNFNTSKTTFSAGNVGIGTTSPSAKLHSVSTTEQLRLGYDATNYWKFTVDSGGNLKLESTGLTKSINFSNNDLAGVNSITINDAGVGEGIFIPNTSGNWSIDSSPLNRSNAAGNLNLYGTVNNIALWRPALFVYNASNYATITPQSNGGINFTTTGGDITFNQVGNVGIGTTGPSYKLDVNGTIHYTTATASSDARFKTNITPIENALEKVNNIRGVRFEWNDFVNSRRNGYELNKPTFGVLAQEIETVFPELVTTWSLSTDCQDARSVNYEKIVPILIEAIKELKTKNDNLENRVLELESK
jgi:hypothetical protein